MKPGGARDADPLGRWHWHQLHDMASLAMSSPFGFAGAEPMDEMGEKMSGRGRNLIALAAMIAIAVVVYFGYRYDYAFNTADEATNFAETFIRNSPVVNSHLGTVTALKQTQEKYTSGNTPKVQLAFDVNGAKGDAVVTVRLDRVNNNTWRMPEARMEIDHKDVNLR